MPADEHADQQPPSKDRALTPFPKASDAERNTALERLRDGEDLVPEQDLPADAPLLRVRLVGLLSALAAKPRFRFQTRPGRSSR